MAFEKDILISYAHIDDESLIEGQKGWISEFHRSLEIRLSQLLGEKPNIWRDPKLQGNDYFGDEIVGQFPQVALLVSILSPRYIKSEWCTKEVGEFQKASEENIGIRVKNKSRIFKVIKTPIDFDEHPAIMQNILGYEFYKTNPETGRAKEFSKIYGSETEQAYWAKLDDLAHDISELLQELKKSSLPNAAAAKDGDTNVDSIQNPSKATVYLAQTSYDLKDYSETVKRELQESGYNVLPNQELPLEATAFSQEVESLLSQCKLSIHLIGSNYGIVPEGTEKSKIELQNELASKRSNTENLQRIIWISPDSEAEDSRQQSFIEQLRNDPVMQAGADIYEASIEDVKFAIEDKLKEPKKEEKPTQDDAVVGADGPPIIYLMCDEQDLDTTTELEDWLYDQGFDVLLPVFDGDEAQVRIEHQENLKICDATLIYYGAGNELWMRSKSRDLMKIVGYGRTKPLLSKGVYMAQPPTRQKERFRSHDTEVIDGLKGFSAENMSGFIKPIKQS